MIVKGRTLDEIDEDLWLLEHKVNLLSERLLSVISFIITLMILLFVIVPFAIALFT